MRADVHGGPEQKLQSEAGYIDARPQTDSSTKTSCNARPDHTLGQSRHFDRAPLTSGLPRLADILRVIRHVSKVPSQTFERDHLPRWTRETRPDRHRTFFAIPTVRVGVLQRLR